MKALIFNKATTIWESSKGFDLAEIPEPVLGVGDEDKIIMKVHYAGVCGTDKGIWNRQAFKEQILNSIDAEAGFPAGAIPEVLSASEKLSGIQSKQGSGSRLSDALGRDGTPRKSYRIIGHEFFGEIKQVGSNVKNLKPGDFVACESHVVCNKCVQCLNGQKEVCTNEKILGISVDGGFAEYAKVPAQVAWKTDTAKIRPEVAAMQEPFGNAVHAASKVNLKGKSVAIFGLGPIGMFLAIVAKGMGASSIIGIEPNPVAEDMAKKLGVDYVIPLNTTPAAVAATPPLQEGNAPAVAEAMAGKPQLSAKPRSSPHIIEPAPVLSRGGVPAAGGGGGNKPYARNTEVISELMKITNGVGFDVSFEMAGFNSSLNNAIASVRRGGDVILFGLKNGHFTIDQDYNTLVMKGLTLHCVAGRQLWQTWETTKALMEDKTNGVQEKLFNVILDRGNGTILPIEDYSKEKFEEMMKTHPKFLIQF